MCAEYWRARRRSAGQYPRTFLCIVMSLCLIASQLIYPWTVRLHDGAITISHETANANPAAGGLILYVAEELGITVAASDLVVGEALTIGAATGYAVTNLAEDGVFAKFGTAIENLKPNGAVTKWRPWNELSTEAKAAYGYSEATYNYAYAAACMVETGTIEASFAEEYAIAVTNGTTLPAIPETTAANIRGLSNAVEMWQAGAYIALSELLGLVPNINNLMAYENELSIVPTESKTLNGYKVNFVSYDGISSAFYNGVNWQCNINGHNVISITDDYCAGGSLTGNSAIWCRTTWSSWPANYIDGATFRFWKMNNNVIQGDGVTANMSHLKAFPKALPVRQQECYGDSSYLYLPINDININYRMKVKCADASGTYTEIESDLTNTNIAETPDDYSDALANRTVLDNNLGRIQDTPEGNTLAVRMPEDGITPTTTFDEIVQVQPTEDVNQDVSNPDSESNPVQPQPKPEEPNPDEPEPDEPNPDEEDFGEGLRTRLIRLFEAPVKNVFPFCLMIDIRDYLSQMTEQFGYESLGDDDEALPNAHYQIDSNGGISLQAVGDDGGGGARDDEPSAGGTGGGGGARPPENDPRFTQITIPITAFSNYIEEDIVLDFAPLRELFLITRPFMTYFVFLGLVFGCLRIYIFRGGE